MLQSILNYWYQLEFFNPCWPVDAKKDTNLLKRAPLWEFSQDNPKIQLSHEVYLGKAKSNDLIEHMMSCLGLTRDKQIEEDKTLTCICALKVDQNGKYIANSFTLSSFVWAIGLLASTGTSDTKLDVSDLDALQRNLDEQIQIMQEDEEALSVPALKQILSMACIAAKIAPVLFENTVWSREKRQYANKKGEFPPIDPSTELMQSFYLKDIAAIRNNPTDTITQYVLAMNAKNSDRICLDRDVVQMQRWVKAGTFPKGVWPSAYNPCLMQQLSINLAISNEQAIFSVNGPPGTGKTTLLKEIVSSNIVERAIQMMAYDHPDCAFTKSDFHDPPDVYTSSFYRIDKALSGHGILVASNNNAAVENISIELPKAIKNDRSKHFTSAMGAVPGEVYFSDVATALLGESAWGLISARLGKKPNIKELKDRLWWANDNITLKAHFDAQDPPNWYEARQNFRKALQAVQEARKSIESAQNLLQQEKRALDDLETAQVTCQKQEKPVVRAEKALQDTRQNIATLGKRLEVQETNAEALRKSIPFFKRIFYRWFSGNAVIEEWNHTKDLAAELLIELIRQKTACNDQELVLSQLQEQYQTAKLNVVQKKNALDQVQSSIAVVRKQFGDSWADDSFWTDIEQNEKSQSCCPWTNAHYDLLREELFFQALQLHKAFILSSKSVKRNLRILLDVWDGKLTLRDRQFGYGHLLNTLFLVIPVISTTFASVQTFLDGVQEKEIGLLIIDEAGQATPQSALGALWRAKKAIVVGDPLQVEPIVTIPKELRTYFAEKNNIPTAYKDVSLSVQVLADNLNRYGGIRLYNGEQIWVGSPLVLHRRCIEPMFSISNQVAYNGKMFEKTKQPDVNQPFLLNTSVWLDCKGKENGNKDHAVASQIRVVSELLKRAIVLYKGLPDIYIITPFTSVAYSLHKELYKTIKASLPSMEDHLISDWLQESCGTIHTFQGKEAQEVLLVLGCDSASGLGAARWVGQKPNIINVAVSRAKYRIGIVGDYALWKNIPYVQTACRHFEPTDADLYLQASEI